jgi:hypothetical protein
MAQTALLNRRDWRWYAAGYAVLVAATGVAAAVLLTRNIALGREAFVDPQDAPQRLAAWRGSAVLAYTSGSEVGHACALLAGLLVAPALATPSRRIGVRVAASAGAVLALVNLLVAWWPASARLAELAATMATMYPSVVLDPGPGRHPSVIIAIVLVAAGYPLLAILGFVLGRKRYIRTAVATLFVFGITAPYSHYFLAVFLVPRPEI